jgi:hypothetical protein
VLSETYSSLNEWPRLSLWQAAKHQRRTGTHGRSANPGAETLSVTFDLAPWEPQKRWGPLQTLAASTQIWAQNRGPWSSRAPYP